MLNNVKRVFFNGEFNRNVLTLITGTGLAQIIPLAVTPILTRIYSPEQFGVFALFVAAASSLSVVATGRYELAIMLPRRDVDAANIAALSIAINCCVSVLLFGIVCMFDQAIADALGNRSIAPWLYLVPLAILLNGTYVNLNYWSNRKKLYVLMANRRVIQSAGMAAVQLGLGVMRGGAGGLVFGSLSGQALSVALMANMIHRQSPRLWRRIAKRRMLMLARRYQNCAKFLVPAHTLSAFSMQFPTILINATFGLTVSGYFMMAERVIGSPLTLVSGAIADVFRQQISQSYIDGKHCRQQFLSALRKLAVIATPPFAILMLFAPALFAMLFGEKWRVSGEYAQLMCPMFFLRFICSPLSVVAIIAQKNRYELLWQGSLLVSLIVAALLRYVLALSAREFILLFTIVFCVLDLAYLWANYIFACQGDRPVRVGESQSVSS